MLLSRFQTVGNGGHIAIVPNRIRPADGQPARVDGNAHRFLEVSEVGVDPLPVKAHQDDLARLVGRDRQADAQLLQDSGHADRVDTVQRLLGGRLWVAGPTIPGRQLFSALVIQFLIPRRFFGHLSLAQLVNFLKTNDCQTLVFSIPHEEHNISSGRVAVALCPARRESNPG